MKRFFAKYDKGKVEATPEVLKLWGTPAGRTLQNLIQTNILAQISAFGLNSSFMRIIYLYPGLALCSVPFYGSPFTTLRRTASEAYSSAWFYGGCESGDE